MKHRVLTLATTGIVSLLPFHQARADVISFASVDLRDYKNNVEVSDSTTGSNPVSAVLPAGPVGSAQSEVATGSVRAEIDLPATTKYGFYTSTANWSDDWTVGGAGTGSTVPILSTITLNGSITKAFLEASQTGTDWADFVDLSFRYEVGNHVLGVTMGSDGDVPSIYAHFDGTDITSTLQFQANPIYTSMMDFSLVYTPTLNLASSGFSDFMAAVVDVNGSGPFNLDAFHTFHVDLTPLDTNVVLRSAGGRSSGSAPVPEPATAGLIGAALAGMSLARRPKRR